MTKTLTKTEDLGQGWFANAYSDGSFTLRNPNLGQRIDLDAKGAEKFIFLYDEVRSFARYCPQT